MTSICGLFRKSSSKDINSCPICFDYMTKNVKKLDCNHEFHLKCINTWEEVSNKCPLCNATINTVNQQNQDILSSKTNKRPIIILCFILLYIFQIAISAYNIHVHSKSIPYTSNITKHLNCTDNYYSNVVNALIIVDSIYYVLTIIATIWILYSIELCPLFCRQHDAAFTIIVFLNIVIFILRHIYYVSINKYLNHLDLNIVSSYKTDLRISYIIFISSLVTCIVASIILHVISHKYKLFK